MGKTLSPLSPEKLIKQAKSDYKKGDYLSSAELFLEVSHQYTSNNKLVEAAEMANNASVAFLQAGDAEKALSSVEGTADVFASAGDLKRQGMALANKAAALEELDLVDDALESYQQAADILGEAGEDKMRADVMKSLSVLQLQEGRQLEALVTMQNGLDGVKHPSATQRLIKKILQIPYNFLGK